MKLFRWRRVATCSLGVLLAACGASRGETIVIGSENFPEQALLGEVFAQNL